MVTPRSYIRFTSQNNDKNENLKINLLAERPTMCSSSTEGHSSRFANDLDTSTYWEANSTFGEASWWQVDMENMYTLSEVKLTFKDEVVAQYIIEISMDGKSWNVITDQALNSEKTKNKNEKIKCPNKGRFLRIVFNGSNINKSINIVDIQAFGK
jgi:hypothetical protein